MEKLKLLIEEFGRWHSLLEYVRRIEGTIDYSLILENIKSLLESIAKQICKEKNVEVSSSDSVQKLIKNAFKAIGFSPDDYTTQ